MTNQQSKYMTVRYPRVGANFRRWLKAHGYAIYQFAKASHTEYTAIYGYTRGIFRPTARVVHRIAQSVHIPEDELLDIFGLIQHCHGFGKELRKLRLEKGLSTVALSKRSHIKQQYICRLERRSKCPTDNIIIKLARGFDMNPSQFWLYVTQLHTSQIGLAIKSIILDQHLSAADIIHRWSVGLSTIMAIIYHRHQPKIRVLFNIAVGSDVSAEYLLKLAGYDPDYVHSYGGHLMMGFAKAHLSFREVSHQVKISRQSISNYVNNLTQPDLVHRVSLSKLIGG